MEEIFKDILEDDEIIIEVIKPNKKRYWKQPVLPFAIPLFWPHLIILLVGTGFSLPFLFARGYKNLYYAYTNKRLIVRSGWIGIDYKTLDYNDITSNGVTVGFLDKGCKTGSLYFENPSAHGKPIIFQFVNNPYDLMKKIKKIIDIYNKK